MNSVAVPLVPTPIEVYWRRRMLIVSDDLDDQQLLQELAGAQGWSAVQARDFGEADDFIHRMTFHCIASEVTIGSEDVGSLVSHLVASMIIAPIVFIGDNADSRERAAQLARRIGLNVCYPMAKPLTAAVVGRRLARIDKRLNDGIEGCCHRDCYCGLLPQAPA